MTRNANDLAHKDSDYETIGEFVKVVLSTGKATCTKCGAVAKDKGCPHATPEEIKGALLRLKEELKLRALVGKDNEALGTLLLGLYRDVIVKYARKFQPDISEREDEFQTILLKIIELIRERDGKFSPDTVGHFTKWMGNIASNVSGNLLKKETQYKSRRAGGRHIMDNRQSIEENRDMAANRSISLADGPVTEVVRSEMIELVRKGLERLQERYGRVYSEPLKLWAIENMTLEQVSEKLQITYDIARTRIKKAQDLLRDLYRQDMGTLYNKWQKKQMAAMDEEASGKDSGNEPCDEDSEEGSDEA